MVNYILFYIIIKNRCDHENEEDTWWKISSEKDLNMYPSDRIRNLYFPKTGNKEFLHYSFQNAYIYVIEMTLYFFPWIIFLLAFFLLSFIYHFAFVSFRLYHAFPSFHGPISFLSTRLFFHLPRHRNSWQKILSEVTVAHGNVN